MKIIHGTSGDIIMVSSTLELENVDNELVNIHGYRRNIDRHDTRSYKHPYKIDTLVMVDDKQAAG